MFKHLKQPKSFYGEVIRLMIPLVLQNIITQTVALADTFMVGLLGEVNLAAVTAAATPFFAVMILTFGVQSATSILSAQYWGKGDTRTINRVMGMGLYCGIGFNLLLAVAVTFFPEFVMGIVTDNEEIIPLGIQYAELVGYAYVCNAITSVYIAVQRSMGNTRLGVFVLGMSSGVNIFLNWVFIFGKLGAPMLGIRGAALATLISRILEVLIIAAYALCNKRLIIVPSLLLRPGKLICRDFIKYGTPVMLNEGLWGFGTSLYSIIMGHMAGSTAILAAYTIVGNVERLVGAGSFAIGNAASIIIGREIGAGHKDTVYGKGAALNFIGVAIGLSISAIMLIIRPLVLEPYLYPLFELSPDACSIASTMIMIMVCVLPFRTLNMTTAIGILRGGGDVKAVLVIDISMLYMLALPGAALSALVFKAGIAVVYAFIMSEDIGKTVMALYRFKSKKWINDVTREQI